MRLPEAIRIADAESYGLGSGFAVETHDSGEYRYVRGKPQRNRAH